MVRINAIQKKNALVVGADSVLGLEVVKALEAEGYCVFQTVRKIKSSNSKDTSSSKTFELDITDSLGITGILETLPELSFVSCLVTSPVAINRFAEVPLSRFENDFRINVLGQIDLFQQLISQKKLASGCNVVIVLSELVLNVTQSFMHSYAVSKHALLGVMKTLAKELESKSIFVNACSPGMMDTPLTADIPSAIKTQYLAAHNRKDFLSVQFVAQQIVKISHYKTRGENYPIV